LKSVDNAAKGYETSVWVTARYFMQEKGDNFSRARESVLSILDLTHFMVYDSHNVCILVKEDKLKKHEAPDSGLQSKL